MDLPSNLIDRTTVLKNHTAWTHVFCVLLRCSLGLYLLHTGVATPSRRRAWTVLAVVVMTFFFYRRQTVPRPTWKVYLRTVVAYGVVLAALHVLDPPEAALLGGTLIIVDALLGLQSRHIATLLAASN